LKAVLSLNTIFVPICAAVLLFSTGCQQKGSNPAAAGPPQAPIVPVVVAKAERQSVPAELRVVGTVEASSIVQVKSQVAGPIDRVAFTEGQNTKKDDLLFVIDPRPFQEAVRQAKAAVDKDRALISQNEAAVARDSANAQFAAADAARYAELSKAGVVSKSQYDQSRTNADATRESVRATQALIESARAALASDQAAVATAELNLSYCEIHAPISGRTGNLLLHAGNLVKANDVPLVVIHQVEPIFVNFNAPEGNLSAIRRLSAGRQLEVRVSPQDNPDKFSRGKLSVIDNTVDTATGTIHLKATFDNRDGALWPGQFVTVVLTLDTVQNATVIPAEAVQPGMQGPFVYVVGAGNKAQVRLVTPGRPFGGKTIIEKGVEPGETVVTDGQLRLAPGWTVRIVEQGKPALQ
jgi:multidrug efflux system membrane fusion protein